jgi:hypothetical protein
MTKYAEMGVLYYTIYNSDYWKRDKHDPFEVYCLERGAYVRQRGNPVWMPEIGLGIGYEQGTHEGWSREWLYWYDQQGNRFPAPENVKGVAQHDEERQIFIESAGIKFLRFTNKDVYENLNSVLETIAYRIRDLRGCYLADRLPPQLPLLRGEQD